MHLRMLGELVSSVDLSTPRVILDRPRAVELFEAPITPSPVRIFFPSGAARTSVRAAGKASLLSGAHVKVRFELRLERHKP